MNRISFTWHANFGCFQAEKCYIRPVFIRIVGKSSQKSFVIHLKLIYGFPPLKEQQAQRGDICLTFKGYPKCFSNSTPSETSLPFCKLQNYSSGMKLGFLRLGLLRGVSVFYPAKTIWTPPLVGSHHGSQQPCQQSTEPVERRELILLDWLHWS